LIGRDRPNNGDAQASVPRWAKSRFGEPGHNGRDESCRRRLRGEPAASASDALAEGMGASYACLRAGEWGVGRRGGQLPVLPAQVRYACVGRASHREVRCHTWTGWPQVPSPMPKGKS